MRNTARRQTALGQLLTDRRRTLQDDVRERIRDGRADRPCEVGDDVEHSDAATQSDIELALTQMRAETLVRIDEALARLGSGQYGTCCECAGDIAEGRLRALPFAVRCRSCEETRERSHRPASRSAFSLFPDLVRV